MNHLENAIWATLQMAVPVNEPVQGIVSSLNLENEGVSLERPSDPDDGDKSTPALAEMGVANEPGLGVVAFTAMRANIHTNLTTLAQAAKFSPVLPPLDPDITDGAFVLATTQIPNEPEDGDATSIAPAPAADYNLVTLMPLVLGRSNEPDDGDIAFLS